MHTLRGSIISLSHFRKKFMMINKLLLVSIIVVINQLLFAQTIVPLYDGLAPNSKPIAEPTGKNISASPKKWKDNFVMLVTTPDLTVFLPEKNKNTGVAVIICPGGGYSGLAMDHEGYDMAKKFAAHGIAGIVLKYRLPNAELVDNKEIVPLQDAQRAIQLVRMNSKKWGINAHKIGILGSSAGGHLASTAGTHFLKEKIINPNRINLRPDFMVLNYPVITFDDSFRHKGSRENLIGEKQSDGTMKISDDKIKEYSNELQVTPNTPPTFINHAVDDNVVPVQNSLLFIAALQKNKVPVESFFYAKGGHGFGMHNPTSPVDWFDSSIQWILKTNKSQLN